MRGTPGLLVTADGEVFRGVSVGAPGVTTGEAVFNTSMSGYQEVVSDPSYSGQIVVMTSPHIGNYGATDDDVQADKPAAAGLVTRSMSRVASSWRAEGSLGDYLKHHSIVSLAEVDTRRLTRHIRDKGAMPAAMGSDVDERDLAEAARSAPEMVGQDLATGVSTSQPYEISATGQAAGEIVAIDLGTKKDIYSQLAARGHDIRVVPAKTSAEQILARAPAGVFVSNGPGDPEPLHATIETLRGLIGRVPVFGICLGHQVLGLAVGARTYKLPFGHHGGNHPVKRLGDGRIEVTAQNHGFAVDLWTLTNNRPPERDGLVTADLLPDVVDTEFGPVQPTHQNLNDGTLEGMRLVDHPVFSVQYHPEAAPGPRDALTLFDEFDRMLEAAHAG